MEQLWNARHHMPQQDYFGMTILSGIGYWCARRNELLQLLQKKKKSEKPQRVKLRMEMQVLLGYAIASILVVARKHDCTLSFQAMDGFIQVEQKNHTTKVDWALGAFNSAFAKWCMVVTCYQEPDSGVTQQMLQLMLNAVGLMAFLCKYDPIVDCFFPIYEVIEKGLYGKASKNANVGRKDTNN